MAAHQAHEEQEGVGNEPTVEEIPDADSVSRLIDFPHKYTEERELIWDSIFAFPKSKGKYTGESVNWSKYCASEDEIHALGCAWQLAKCERVPDMRYVGFMVAVVGDIRQIQTRRGHAFEVIHAPEEGRHHAEIRYLPSQAANTPFESHDREELKLVLQSKFSALTAHECSG